MNQNLDRSLIWASFCELNAHRRAIRHFDGGALNDGDLQSILAETLLAPSSGNLQPYQLHVVRDAETKRLVAHACGDQGAADSAAALIVIVASVGIAQATAERDAHAVDASDLGALSKAYHHRQIAKFQRVLRWAPLFLWAPLRALLALWNPVYSLIPLGPSGALNWVARSALYAAQTLMLAASARGLDSCPMEGFSPRRIAKILRLPRGSVIPIVIAIGTRAVDARVEPRWRRSLADTVVTH